MLRRPSRILLWGAYLTGTGLLLAGVCLANQPKQREDKSQTERVPFTVSPVQEVALGERAVASFMKDRVKSDDIALTNRINRIGHEIAKVSDRPSLLYQFLLVEGDELQARSFPGGTVCITEALARFYASDDELAFAMAHELAHTALRHHIQQARFIEAMKGGTSVEEALLAIASKLLRQDDELEADRFGALYSVRAGHDSFSATYASLGRLEQATGRRFDDAHPDYGIRIEALKAFRDELELSVQTFHDGVKALDRRDADEAISLFKYFVSEFPNSVSGRVNLGLAHIARMRSKTGTPQGLAEVLVPLRDPGVSIRSSILDRVDVNMARGNFERAIEIQPDSGSALAGLGIVHTRLGQYGEARMRLNQAKENVPKRWDILLCLGNVEYLDKNYEEAVSYYDQAREMEPTSVEIKKNLALALEQIGNRAKAMALWRELESHPLLGLEAKIRLRDLGRPSTG